MIPSGASLHLCNQDNYGNRCPPVLLYVNMAMFFPIQEKHIMSERNVLLKNVKHPFLVGLHFSFQTADKLYFVLDYINGGEVGT